MSHFVYRHPLIIDDFAGSSNWETRLDLVADVLKPQDPIILSIDPDPSTITGDSFAPQRSAFTPAEGLPRMLALDLVLVDDGTPPAQSVRIDSAKFCLTLRRKQ